MNRLDELNSKYIELLNSVTNTDYRYAFRAYLSEKNQIVLEDKTGKMFFEAIDEYRGELLNSHIIVKLNHYSYKTNRTELQPLKRKYPLFTALFEVFKQYWLERAKLSGAEGIVFVASEDSKLEHFIENGLKTTQEDISLSLYSNQQFFDEISALRYIVIGAYSNEEALGRMEDMVRCINVLKEVMEAYPETRISWGNSRTLRVMMGHVAFIFAGETITVHFTKDYKQMKFEWSTEGVSEPEDISAQHIKNYFEQVVVKNRMKNLLNPPQGNFDRLIYSLFSRSNSDARSKEFLRLIEVVGDWREVEKMCSIIEAQKEKELYVKIHENVRYRNIQVYRIQYEGQQLYFCYNEYRSNPKGVYDRYIIRVLFEKEKNPTDLMVMFNEWLTLDNEELERLY